MPVDTCNNINIKSVIYELYYHNKSEKTRYVVLALSHKCFTSFLLFESLNTLILQEVKLFVCILCLSPAQQMVYCVTSLNRLKTLMQRSPDYPDSFALESGF